MADEIDHDMDRWGAAETDEFVPRPVVRLAELVKRRMLSARLPVKIAASQVTADLRQGMPEEFFLFRPGERVLKLTETDQWQPPVPFWRTPVRRVYADHPWKLECGPFEPSDDCAKRGWHGISAMLTCLHHCWVMHAQRQADLDEDLAGRIAILKTDAARLFPVAASSTGHHLNAAKPAAEPTDWTGDRLATRRDELKHLKEWMPTLEAESGLIERNIQRRIKKSECANLRVNLPAALTGVGESTGLNWTAPMLKVAKASKSKS